MNQRQRGGLGRWQRPEPERFWRRLPRLQAPHCWPDARSLAGSATLLLAAVPLASFLCIVTGVVHVMPVAAWAGTLADVLRMIALMSIAFWPAAVVWTVLLGALGLWVLWR